MPVPWWPLFAASGPSIDMPRTREMALASCSAVSDTRATVVDRHENRSESIPFHRNVSGHLSAVAQRTSRLSMGEILHVPVAWAGDALYTERCSG
jgi:hypothetical protein